MRQPMAIPAPTVEASEAPATPHRTARDVRLRTRARPVLLAAEQGLTAPAIAAIVREAAATVRR